MSRELRSPVGISAPRAQLWQTALALVLGFVRWAGRLVTSLARVLPWRRRARSRAPGTSDRLDIAGSAATAMLPRDDRSAPCAQGHSGRIALPQVEVVEVDPELNERHYATVFARLQVGAHAKLLDLRAARRIPVGLFERLASAWRAPRGSVPRLGILLGYESWTVLRNVAARRLRPIAKRGVEIEIFYSQQLGSLSAWFADGRVRHDHLRDVIEWLRTQWQPTAIWPTVLATTARLVQTSAEADAGPDMLLELAAIARSFDGSDGAEEAVKYARAALSWIGDQPSPARCRGLRAIGVATITQGEIEAGLAWLETAVTTAMLIAARVEEATALAEIGFHMLRARHFARAEARFRRAIAVLSAEDPVYLRATLHHHLASALHEQGKAPDEAEHHATAALALRWDKESRLASEDRALLMRIRAVGVEGQQDERNNSLHEHQPPRET